MKFGYDLFKEVNSQTIVPKTSMFWEQWFEQFCEITSLNKNFDYLNKPEKDRAIIYNYFYFKKCGATIHKGSIKELSHSKIFEIFEKHEREAENYDHLQSETEVKKK